MASISQQQLNALQKQLNDLATIAESSDASIIAVLNEQAKAIHSLQQVVALMYSKLQVSFPELKNHAPIMSPTLKIT